MFAVPQADGLVADGRSHQRRMRGRDGEVVHEAAQPRHRPPSPQTRARLPHRDAAIHRRAHHARRSPLSRRRRGAGAGGGSGGGAGGPAAGGAHREHRPRVRRHRRACAAHK
eukprot:691910-Pyramimonas_sp.AAC.1